MAETLESEVKGDCCTQLWKEKTEVLLSMPLVDTYTFTTAYSRIVSVVKYDKIYVESYS